ncbi:unnamed protein product [Rhizoctonia solani]|uniref:Uncharacterized protein n=1 Tax=Rhizoctonia solani TaxID=456999 RepID=A0A8H3GT77_9AGAM|nr:unnamed protein product [Rhizoctonia solani]
MDDLSFAEAKAVRYVIKSMLLRHHASWLCLYKLHASRNPMPLNPADRSALLSSDCSFSTKPSALTTLLKFSPLMTSITRPRLSSIMQSNAISHSTYQIVGGQRAVRRPTIGAPEVVLAEQPAASLKRRSHIRRTSRSGHSPTFPEGHESMSSPTAPRSNRQELTPLITAFTRSVATSISSGSIIARQNTLIEHSGVESKNSSQYQPKVTPGGDITRRSTVASVYSLPSAAPHDSRRSTQENYILDWSFVDRALQNRAESPVASPHCNWPLHDYAQRSSTASQTHAQRANICNRGDSASLSRSNTTQVRSLIMDRQQRRNILSTALPE